MNINIPGVNTEKGLDLYDDDEDTYLLVIRSYAENTPSVLDKIRTVTAESLPDFATAVHGIKGTSNTIGAEQVGAAALELEKLSKAGDLAGVQERHAKFVKSVETLLNDINSWLKNNS